MNVMNQSNPLVSVLIPVYGVENYICRCLESIQEQSYKNIEVILVNDCTQDKSIEVAENFLKSSSIKEKTRIIHHKKNRGLSAARNTAVEASTGLFVMHVDSDDYIAPKTVEESVNIALAQKADAVLFGFKHKFQNFEKDEHVAIPHDKKEYLRLLLERQIPVCLCGGLYKRSLYTDYGIEELEGYDYEEDYITKPRLLYNANHIIALDKPIYIYNHVNEGSMTRTFKSKCIEDTQITISTLRSFYEKKDDYIDYSKSIDIASLKLKANLLRNWSLNNGGVKEWNIIRNLFPSQSLTLAVGIKEYISLRLAKADSPTLLRLYNKWGNKIMHHIKHLTAN